MGAGVIADKLCPVCGHAWSHHVGGARCAHVFGFEDNVTHVCGCEEVQKEELSPEIAAAVGSLAMAFLFMGR